MQDKTRLSLILGIVAVAALGAITVTQYLENRRMRAVLIDETIKSLDRQYEQARQVEERNLARLNAELDTLLQNLARIQGLTATERQWINQGLGLIDEIQQVTAGMHLTYGTPRGQVYGAGSNGSASTAADGAAGGWPISGDTDR